MFSALCETCEPRVMLRAALDALIPTSIPPNSAPQTLLAGANNTFSMVSNSMSTAVHSSYRFVLNDSAPGQLVDFFTSASQSGQPDTAIALYDASGNRIMLQDTDTQGISTELLFTPLQSGQQYTVAFYAIETSGFFSPSDTVNMQIIPGPQATADTLNINPVTGSGTLTTSNSPDSFTSPSQVRYFPLNLIDVGQSATITLTPTDADTAVDATLYSIINGNWTQVSTASLAAGASSTTLAVTPPTNADITDASYELAVAPLNFTASLEPVTIAVTSSTLLPATVSPAAVNLGLAESVTSLGVLSGTATGSFNGSEKLAGIIAQATGPLTVTYSTTSSIPLLLGIYGPGGSTLLNVTTSRVGPDTLTATFNAVAGSSYFFELAQDASSFLGTFNVTATQAYTPSPLAVSSTLASLSLPTLANSNGVIAYQLTPTAGTNFVALQLTPTAPTLQVQVVILGSNQPVTGYLGGAVGQPVTVVIDESKFLGPYDVLLSGVGGTGAGATFKCTAVTAPTTIPVNQFATASLNLASGSLATASLATTTGSLVGVQYFQPATNAPLTLSTYSANSSGGGTAILLHYVQNGSVFQLAEAKAPNIFGIAQATDVARGQDLHALVALPVNFSGSGTVQLSVAGPLPKGTALAEVPNAIPGQNTSNYQSSTSVTSAILTSPNQLDLYSVQLPFNLTSTSSSLQFNPVDVGGPLNATVSILNSANNVLATATNTPGQPVSIPVSSLTPGQTLRFLVQPVAGSNVGGHGYGFSMTVNTTNPLPYLVTETSFYPYVSSGQIVGRSYFPQTFPTASLNFGTAGGTLGGNFTSSQPYANNGTGSIQVFEIKSFNLNTPFTIYTTDNTPNVDTNLALFVGTNFNSSGNATQYVPLPGTSPSFDYYPADRTQVDAQVIVNNTDLDPSLTGGEIPDSLDLFVVVMNEQGTQGSYTLHADPITPTTTGPGVVNGLNVLPVYPASTGQYAPFTLDATNGGELFVRTPSDVGTGNSNLLVKTSDLNTGQVVKVLVEKSPFAFGSTFTGTIGSNGSVNIPFGLAKNTSYHIFVSSTPFPQFGLYTQLTVPIATATGPMPALNTTINVPSISGYNSAETRLDPGPDGLLSQTLSASSGSFSTVFSIQTGGVVTLSVAYPGTASNVSIGLYQAGTNSASPFNTEGVLLDYTYTLSNGLYTITADLPAGTYVLNGAGSVPAGSTVTVTGTTPAVLARVVSVEPGTGTVFGADATIASDPPQYFGGLGSIFPTGRFVTAYFATTVPANANGQPIKIDVYDNPSLAGPSTAGAGTVSVTLWRFSNGVYTNVGTLAIAINDSLSTPTRLTLTGSDSPVPGTQYFIGIDEVGMQSGVYLKVTVPINTTGTPDFSVTPLLLLPDGGQTLVQTQIINGSFTASPATTYTIQLGSTTVTRSVPGLAPFGSYLIQTPVTPVSNADAFQVIVNPGNHVAELSALNDATQLIPLSSVDATAPHVTIALADAAMTAEGNAAASQGGGTWGRYISGVSGQTSTILVTGTDSDSDLFEVSVTGPHVGGPLAFYSNSYVNFVNSDLVSIPIDFGTLKGSSSTNLNQIQFFALDIYGLRTATLIQNLDVATPPSFLTGGIPADGTSGAGGTIKFNQSNHQFTYTFQDSVISLSDTLSQLLNFDVPIVGDKKNQFLVAINGTGTGGLSPTSDVFLNLSGHAKLVALDDSLFDKTYQNPYNASSNLSFQSMMSLAGRSLVPGSVSVNLTLKTLPLFTYNSPLIPILSFGIPGIASVDAGIKFSVASNISGGATLGLDPNGLTSPGSYLGAIGVMSPTFIQPSIMGTASVTGQVSVLGYDVGDLSGNIALTLTLTLGLDNAVQSAVIPVSDAVSDLALTVDAKLKVGISASVFGFDVFDYNIDKDYGNIINTVHNGIFLTYPPSFGAGKFIAPPGPGVLPRAPADPDPTAVISMGNSLVGAFKVDPSPQIVINNTTGATGVGTGLTIQTINVGTASAPLENLAFATRANASSGWSTSTTLSGTNDADNPVLALTHDVTGTPAVVSYLVDDAAGSPSTQTLNQRLDSSDLRYRYFNGSAWGPELSLTNDNLYDSEQTEAFDANGNGVLAYVHNTDSVPISTSTGNYDTAANDIYASVWNKTTHTWSTALAVSAGNGVADGKPATFVDSTGKQYVMWVRGTGATTQLMYSTFNGTSWSSPAVFAVSGLAPGGEFKNVAMGSDGTGRVNVLFTYAITNPDGSIINTLYQRPSTNSTFTNLLPAVQVAANANFSTLKTTSAPSGALVAYWEQSDGQSNQIFESTLMNGIASAPTQVTDSPDVASKPSAAVDTNGTLQVLYDNSILYGGTSQGSPTDPTVGVPMVAGAASSSVQALPQLTFINSLTFPVESQAVPTGSSITGTAVIANRGLATATVTITAYDGLPGTGTVVGSPKTITLLPGAIYNESQAFIVLAGSQTYSLQLTTPSGQAFNTTENISSTTLSGAGDLVQTQLTTDSGTASPGQSITLFDFFNNPSTSAIGAFDITLYAGDPLSPEFPLTALATQHVTGLAASSSSSITFNVTVPAGAGDDVYTAVLDSGNVITESNENNNEARFEVVVKADPNIYDPGTGAVTATLLNANTSNNVQVMVNVQNSGAVPLFNVPVDLSVSRNGGNSISLGQMIIPELDPGTPVVETFTVSALAGDNLFTGAIDSAVFGADLDLSNNTGTADLFVPGLPTLTANVSLSSNSAAAGSPLTLTANLFNGGIADATGVPLIVLAQLTSGGPSFVVGTASGSAPALGSQLIPIALNTSSLVPGAYTLTLEIDPNQTLLQGSITGSTVTIPVTITGSITLTGPAEYLRFNTSTQTLDVWNATSPTGAPNQQINLASIGALTIAAPSGSQNVTVDFINGDPLPSGGLIYTGPAGGTNILNLFGSAGNDTATINASTVTFTNSSLTAPISYTNAIAINFNGNAGSDTLIQTAQPGSGAGVAYLNPNSLSTLNVSGGRFTFPAAQAGAGFTPITFGTITVGNGAVVAMSLPNGIANRSVLIVNTVAFTGTGSLDLSINDLIIHTTSLASVTNFIKTGYSNGSWTGAGITSSAAASDPARLKAIGVASNNLGASNGQIVTLYGAGSAHGTFDGQNPLTNDVLVKLTYYGDADLNGKVDGSDYSRIDAGFLSQSSPTPLAGWYNGDFNYDNIINGSDYTLIDNAYNAQGTALPSALITGEPTKQIATLANQDPILANRGMMPKPAKTSVELRRALAPQDSFTSFNNGTLFSDRGILFSRALAEGINLDAASPKDLLADLLQPETELVAAGLENISADRLS